MQWKTKSFCKCVWCFSVLCSATAAPACCWSPTLCVCYHPTLPTQPFLQDMDLSQPQAGLV